MRSTDSLFMPRITSRLSPVQSVRLRQFGFTRSVLPSPGRLVRSVPGIGVACRPCADKRAHLIRGIRLADVVLAGEVLDVAVQVLRAELVEDAHVRPLQGAPE